MSDQAVTESMGSETDLGSTPPNGRHPGSTPPNGRRRLLAVAVVVVLVALLATVWRLGGFREQQRPFQIVAPGTPINAGPFELTFTEATARHKLRNDYRAPSWEITVIGAGRTTGEETISPEIGGTGSMLLARDQTTGEVKYPESQRFGDGGSSNGFTPGLPPVRYTVTFEFEEGFRPADTLRIAVADQIYGNRSLIKTGDDDEKEWHNARDGWRMELPLSELAPLKD